jgi:hypothetical protein
MLAFSQPVAGGRHAVVTRQRTQPKSALPCLLTDFFRGPETPVRETGRSTGQIGPRCQVASSLAENRGAAPVPRISPPDVFNDSLIRRHAFRHELQAVGRRVAPTGQKQRIPRLHKGTQRSIAKLHSGALVTFRLDVIRSVAGGVEDETALVLSWIDWQSSEGSRVSVRE